MTESWRLLQELVQNNETNTSSSEKFDKLLAERTFWSFFMDIFINTTSFPFFEI